MAVRLLTRRSSNWDSKPAPEDMFPFSTEIRMTVWPTKPPGVKRTGLEAHKHEEPIDAMIVTIKFISFVIVV